MDRELLSIIVPVYNVEDYLEECLQSLLAQTYQEIEIILVDDGSTDKSAVLCDRYRQKDPRIQVLHQENGGPSRARNVGCRQARGSWFLFVDADDVVSPRLCEKLYAAARERGAQIAVAGTVKCKDPGSVKEKRKGGSPLDLTRQEALLCYFYREIPGYACGKLYHRPVLGDLSFPDGKYYEDSFLVYKILDRADAVVVLPDTLYYYRQRPGSIIHSAFSQKQMAIMEACREPFSYWKEMDPALERAVYSKLFVSAVDILQKTPKREARYQAFVESVMEEIGRCAPIVQKDPRNGWMVKTLALIARIFPGLLWELGRFRKLER